MSYLSTIIKRVLSLILLTIGLFQHISSFGQNSFELVYSTPDNEEIVDGLLHSSGNVFLTGRTRTYGTGDYYPLLLKIDEEGGIESVVWQNQDTIGFYSQLLELDNGNIMLIGQCGLITVSEFTKRWIRIIDYDLNIVSDQFFTLDSSYISVYQNKAVKDIDGNIVVLGIVEFDDIYPGFTTTDFYIAKYSQVGVSLAFKVFPFLNHHEEVYDLTCIPGTDQYLAVTSAFTIGMPFPQIVRISHDLEIINHTWFSQSEIKNPCSLNHWLNNSTYLMSNLSLDYEDEDHQVGIIKADTNANIIKSVELGKTDTIEYPAWLNSLEYINDSTVYIGGFMDYLTFWTTEPSFVELFLIDTNLNLLGYKQFGGDINYQLYGITATADGGCLLYTSTYSDSNLYQERDVHIFKVPRDSIEIVVRINDLPLNEIKQLTVYPNPVHDVLNIPIKNSNDNIQIQLFKADGKKVLDVTKQSHGNLITLNVNHLTPGVYIYRISSSDQYYSSGKFIKR